MNRTSVPAACALMAALIGCNPEALPPLPTDGGAGDLAMAVVPDLAALPPDLSFVPAAHPPAPQIPDNGGPKLTRPSLVTVTWAGDPLAPDLHGFDSWLVQSHYFVGSLGEYGIQAGSAEQVSLPAQGLPATLDDADIRALLKSGIDNGTLPPVTPDRLYVVYPPEGVVVTYGFGGPRAYQSCTEFTSYHDIGAPTVAGPIVYVVTPRCHYQGIADLDYTTWGASARIAEAVTNPTRKGWQAQSFDLAWVNGTEVTGPCAGQERTVQGYMVNAIYSNTRAAKDERACVPAPAGPAFGAVARPDTLQIKPGESGRAMLSFWSSAPLPKALRLSLYAYPMGVVTAKAGSLLVDNGQSVPLDITVSPGAKSGDTLYVQLSLLAADYYVSSYVQILVP